MSKGGQTTTQNIDPAVRPYRDAFLRQAFQTAGSQPLQQYGVPGQTPGPFPGGTSAMGGGAGRPRGLPWGIQPGSPEYTQWLQSDAGKAYTANPNGDGGPMVGAGMQPNFGFGGGDGGMYGTGGGDGGMYGTGGGDGGMYGTGGSYGNAVGSVDPWVAGPSSYTMDALNTPMSDRINSFMSPYEKSVIDATRGDFNYQRDLAQRQTNDVATKERAFGGSRHGLLEGQALGDINRSEASTVSGLRYGGYKDATASAFNDRNFLFGAGDYMRGIGQQGIDAGRKRFDERQQLPFQRLGFMQSALTGLPMGSQTTQPGGNVWSQLLGAGMSAASFL